MIRIHRPADQPAILINRGQNETNNLCDKYNLNSNGYNCGTEKFPTADRTIYGDQSVRNALKKMPREQMLL